MQNTINLKADLLKYMLEKKAGFINRRKFNSKQKIYGYNFHRVYK